MKDKLWIKIKSEASEILLKEPTLSPLINRVILNHACLEEAIIYQLSQKLSSNDISDYVIKKFSREAFGADDTLIKNIELDLLATFERDPACVNITLTFKLDWETPTLN